MIPLLLADHGGRWCADLTYLPLRRGFLDLVTVMDWATRKVLSGRKSDTIARRPHGVMSARPTGDVEFCLEALEEALMRSGRPGIFNTERGCQFTAPRFTSMLHEAGVRASMDGRGRWMDNFSSNGSGAA